MYHYCAFIIVERLDLLALAGNFEKNAGLLKVPDKLLKEAEDFIVGRFCHYMKEKYKNMLIGNKDRIANVDMIKKQLDEWKRIYEHIENIHYSVNNNGYGDEVREQLNQLMRGQDNFYTSMQMFNRNELDPYTNLTGEWDKYLTQPNALQLSIRVNAGKYSMIFAGNFHTSDGEKIYFLEDPDKTYPTPIGSMLAEHISEVDTIIRELERFYNSYEVFSEGGLKDIMLCYGMCKKLDDRGNIDSQIFTMDSSNFSYTRKELYIPKVDVGVRFVKSKQEASSIEDPADWRGLWIGSVKAWIRSQKKEDEKSLPYIDTSKVPYIGTVYIVSDIEKEFTSNSASLWNLRDTIDQLKITTKHEFGHFVQAFIKFLNIGFSKQELEKGQSIIDMGGLPGKKIRDSRIYPSGLLKSKTKPEEFSSLMEPEDKWKRILHPLRDVEFYTRLSDSVVDFNKTKKRLPLVLQKDFARFWVDNMSQVEFNSRLQDILYELAYARFGLVRTENNVNREAEKLYTTYWYTLNNTVYSAARKGHTFFLH